MRNLSIKSVLIFLTLLLAGTHWLSTSANALYVDMHGCTAQVEYPANTGGVVHNHLGVGFVQMANTSNWVHFAIPTSSEFTGRNVRYIYLVYYQENNLGALSVKLMDGRNREVKVVIPAGDPGWNARAIDLGASYYSTYGVAVSIQITTGTWNTLYYFTAVSANMQ
jgi:hypothetical protein